MYPPFSRTAAGRQTRALAWLSVLPVVGTIAISCTDAAGAWCSQTFDIGFHALFGHARAGFGALRFVAEKSVHVTLFTILGAALGRAFRGVPRRAWWALATGCALGSGSELFQRLFPTRDPALRDVLINGASVWVGVFLSFWGEQRSGTRQASAPARAEVVDRSSHRVDLLALRAHMESLAQKARDWPALAGETSYAEVGAQQNALVGKRRVTSRESNPGAQSAELVSK